ncbi:aspartate-semialdehyde dehydrogenase [Patescibacteria group bacterium]|nr:aspartate-semialdehyde dehydrogenase [Patescibacteria group bacterium]MBU4481582.1 aspartate-semialdehyde dehydrogenase [Patescibacteria group bacterium]
MKKINVGILGATGMVGQRFMEMLAHHPYFNLKVLMASKDLVGKPYSQVCNWFISREMPKEVCSMLIKEAKPEAMSNNGVEIVFSAVPADIAKELEPKFALAGYKVFSNASAFRMEEDVPLLIAEINPDHLELLKAQQQSRRWPGFIVTNPNCTTIIMTLVLKPLLDNFGIKEVLVSTMQAVSGAGYPGVASLDIIDNVLPYIREEEEKMESEPLKILDADFKISASCHRVATTDGHLEDLHISLAKPVSIEQIKKVLADFGKDFKKLSSSPEKLLIVTDDPMRPQPKLDRLAGNGMSVTVGRIREDSVLENGVKMNILGHNTIRGAAGQSILNAEFWAENNLNYKSI